MPRTKEEKEKKQARDQKAQEGRQEKKRFEETKKRVWEYEKKNHEKLIIFRSTRGWWKMGGASALVYTKVLAPRLNKNPVMREDTDFFAVFSEGVVSIPSIDGFKKDMEKLEMEISNETEEWVSYNLGWKVSHEDLKKWRAEEEEKKNKLRKMIMPKIREPDLWIEIQGLVKIVYANVRKENIALRECHGTRMLMLANELMQDFVKMSRGELSEEEGYAALDKNLDGLGLLMVIIMELRAWDMSAQARFALQLEKIKEILKEENGGKTEKAGE